VRQIFIIRWLMRWLLFFLSLMIYHHINYLPCHQKNLSHNLPSHNLSHNLPCPLKISVSQSTILLGDYELDDICRFLEHIKDCKVRWLIILSHNLPSHLPSHLSRNLPSHLMIVRMWEIIYQLGGNGVMKIRLKKREDDMTW